MASGEDNKTTEKILHPQVGESYASQDDFIEAIRQYGLNQGFTIRCGKVDCRNKEQKIRKRTILCSREGTSIPKKDDQSKRRNRKSQRCGCKYMVRASLNSENNKLYIIALKEEHNHPMLKKEQLRFTQQERNLPDDVKDRILLLRRAGCDVPRILSILKEEFSGKITWIYNDIYNFIYRIQGSTIDRNLDAAELIKTLELMQEENPEFKFSYMVNPETNRLVHVIWMFAEQRMYYSRFNDIIVFDNTYQTNRFHMPFGIFTGVNNLGQSVCFAGTLTSSESEESFTWIFSEFLNMVNNKAPQVLLTDDDKGIANAYNNTFRQCSTKHRLRQWHLLKNLMKNLASTLNNQWSNFVDQFYECLKEHKQAAFNELWASLKNNYSKAIPYLERMEKTVDKWAACYNQNVFMADMTTTQRGESMNHLMKGYLDSTTSLSAFIQAFETALDARKECAEFEIYQQDNINLQTASPYEKQAANLLTRFALRKTQEQLIQSSNYRCELSTSSNLNNTIMIVQRYESTSLPRSVTYFSHSKVFECDCGYTQFSGFICRHIFRAALQLNFEELPTTLFYSRWCKDLPEYELAQQYRNFYSTTTIKPDPVHSTVRKNQDDQQFLLTRLCHKVQRFTKANPHLTKKFVSSIETILELEVKTLELSRPSSNNEVIKNPYHIKTKGAPSKKRKKSITENASKKQKILKSKQNQKDKENQPENPITETLLCPGCNIPLLNQLSNKEQNLIKKYQRKRSLTPMDNKFHACMLHVEKSSAVPQGISKGYPTDIDFTTLPSRISKHFSVLTDIINEKVPSFYRSRANEIINDIGQVKASMPMFMMNRFRETLPGYYGMKGLSIIAEHLQKHFIIKKVLTKTHSSPQTPNQYLYDVLIPETASRLISEDQDNISLERARIIMEESVDFGMLVYPDDDEE